MGLDMYLDRKVYNHYGKDADGRCNFTRPEVSMGDQRYQNVRELIVEFGYWRKANQIHKWFVDNIQDGNDNCQTYYVPIEKLVELRELCKKVLKNHKLAPKLLPTEGGFFFGSTAYDEDYFADLTHTVEMLEGIEKSVDDFVYWSSW